MEEKIKFSHLIVLKTSPYYIYSEDEDSATEIASKYNQEDIIGIVVAKDDELEMKEIKVKVVLQSVEIKQIPTLVKVDENTYEEHTAKEISEEDKGLLEKVLEKQNKENSKELQA